MSTSPESAVVNVLSRWLAGHVTNEEVERELAQVDAQALGGESAELLAELRAALAANGHGGELERLVRETLEAVALGA
jgi:hypothetical protein